MNASDVSALSDALSNQPLREVRHEGTGFCVGSLDFFRKLGASDNEIRAAMKKGTIYVTMTPKQFKKYRKPWGLETCDI